MIDEGMIITFRNDFFSAISTGQLLTIPSRIIVAAGVFTLLWLALRRTAMGLFVESIGGNAEAARLAGVRVDAVRVLTFALSGTAAGLAGVIDTSRVLSAQASF